MTQVLYQKKRYSPKIENCFLVKLKAYDILVFRLGEKLLPNDKYAMSESALNDYSWQMKLTVNSLKKKDFGEYVCSSENALGKADGVARLQGKSLHNINIIKYIITEANSSRILR